MNTRALLALLIVAAGGWAQRPVETAPYLTGAAGLPNDPALLELYRKAGFTLSYYNQANADWCVQHGLKLIGTVSSYGLPADVAKPFEASDGTQSMSVGLFTHVNFNAPEVEAWWTKRVPELVRTMTRADQVAYWKVHNEFGYHHNKIWDYSPGSIARYQRWLQQRYPTIAALNERWRTRYASFAAIQPPRTLPTEELANWLEWRRFTCWNFGDYFRTTGDLIRSVVPGAKVSDNLYPTNPLQGWDPIELSRQTDFIAYDIYSIGRWDNLVSSLDEGRSAGAAWGKPFLMLEYHAGPNHWAREVLADDLFIEAGLALARECRAITWYMFRPGAGGREQGIHGMTDSQGRPTERLTAVRDIAEKTSRLAPLLATSRVEAAVAIVESADNSYLAAAQRTDPNRARRQWDNLGRLLDDARIPHDLIDPVWIAAHDLGRYRAIIVPNVPALADAVVAKLRAHAAAGGTVIFQPDSALTDDLGTPRAQPLFATAASPVGPWQARLTDGQAIRVETTGRGRVVLCGWELPDRFTNLEQRYAMAREYAALLAEHAGVTPAVTITPDTAPETLDAMRLRAGDTTLLFVTALSREPRANVTVTLPNAGAVGNTAWLLEPRTSRVTPLAVRLTGGAATLTIPRVAPTATVLLTRSWQPLVGVDSPPRMVPGGRYPLTVTVDNLGAEVVAGTVKLNLPAGWTATPRAGERLAEVAVGGRGTVVYDLAVPASAAIDRFGLESPVTAQVTFDRGRTGSLAATALPLLVPPLDVAVRSHGELANPWQELAPRIMRWGWENEVITPPPAPVAIGAEANLELTITADTALRGRVATLAFESGATITPAQLTLTGGEQTVAAKVRLTEVGEARLVVTAGDARTVVAFATGVGPETVAARLGTAKVPDGWTPLRRLAVGARQAPARGTPVGFDVELTPAQVEAAQVLDEAGQPVPATIGRSRVTFTAHVPADEARSYLLAAARPDGGVPIDLHAVRSAPTADGGLAVTTDTWQVEFDSRLGLVRSLTVGGGNTLAPHRTGVVASLSDGTQLAPDGRQLATSFATSASPVAAVVDFARPLGTLLTATEKWSIEADHAAVVLNIRNTSTGPVTLARLDYELGLDPTAAPRWRRAVRDGRVLAGELPTGFGGQSGDLLLDWFGAGDRGLGLTLGRCALASKFQSGWQGVRHHAGLTALGLMAGIRLDPGDWVLAEFDLWPHDGPLPVAAARVPELVTAAGPP